MQCTQYDRSLADISRFFLSRLRIYTKNSARSGVHETHEQERKDYPKTVQDVPTDAIHQLVRKLIYVSRHYLIGVIAKMYLAIVNRIIF